MYKSRNTLPLLIVMCASLCAGPALAAKKQSLDELAARFSGKDPAVVAAGLKGKSFVFTQSEVDAFLKDMVARKGKGHVQDARVVLQAEKTMGVRVDGRFNWKDLLKGGKDSLVTKFLGAIGGMDNTVEIKVQSSSARGKGYVKVLSAKVNGITLPDSLVSSLLGKVGKKQRPPIDFSGLMSLPYGIQKVDLLPGAVKVVF